MVIQLNTIVESPHKVTKSSNIITLTWIILKYLIIWNRKYENNCNFSQKTNNCEKAVQL